MVFSSLTFLCVFLPTVFVLNMIVPNIKAKNVLLIVASLLFYAYGEPVYVLLMLASTIANWLFGRLLGRFDCEGNRLPADDSQQGLPLSAGEGESFEPVKRRAVLVCAIMVNLGVLCVFKYAGMIVETFNALFGMGIPVPQITLPIGISFFTFQAMSYVIDVYRRQVSVERSYAAVLLYISFFPQLIAGPIVKYHDIAAQIFARKASTTKMAYGLRRFCVGLAKKVLIANQMAVVADSLFAAAPADINILGAWLAALAYMMQIYFDFSAYSDMAIGLGKMFGFDFKENFNYPYKSRSIKEFWRRWHISLSTWFKEYLYIPLGGNRKGRPRACFNRLVVFFLCGLWHGASWTFVLWGLYHGLFLLLEEFIPRLQKLPAVLGHIYALLVVIVGWVLFRAETLEQCRSMLTAMFTGFTFSHDQMALFLQQLNPLFISMFVVACIGALPVRAAVSAWVNNPQRSTGIATAARAASFVGAFAMLVVCILELSGGGYNPFIYFRF